jgi:Protein of unknown function (DUF2505)
MSTRFEHRATFSSPAGIVYSTLVDRGFLEERLRVLGGKNAALVNYSGTGDKVSFRLRQGVDANRLPGAVKAILKGDLVVEREEHWADRSSTAKATISGVPGEITSRTVLNERDGGCELVTTAEVRVSIPLVGGKLEGVIAEQVGKLLAAESEFTGKWLAENKS